MKDILIVLANSPLLMQSDLTIRAWIVLIILNTIGISVAVFAVSKAIRSVLELIAWVQWHSTKRRFLSRLFNEQRKGGDKTQ